MLPTCVLALLAAPGSDYVAYLLFLWGKFMLLSVPPLIVVGVLFGVLPSIEAAAWAALVEAIVYGFATGNLVIKSDHTIERG